MNECKLSVSIRISVDRVDGVHVASACQARELDWAEARDISKVDHALHAAGHQCMRETLANHLSELSRTVAEAQAGPGGQVRLNAALYRVEAEVGRLEFPVWTGIDANGVTLDTSTDLYPPLTGIELFKTNGFKEIAFSGGCVEMSYRKASDDLNRIRCQPGATSSRSLCGFAESEGGKLHGHITAMTGNILRENGFSADGSPDSPDSCQAIACPVPHAKAIAALLEKPGNEYDRVANVDNQIPYEDTSSAVVISVDDVEVKRQRDTRDGVSGEAGKRKKAKTSVAHIQCGGAAYVLNSDSIISVLKMVLAFLLANGLMGRDWVFITDGERSLKNNILALFAWRKRLVLILDYYHITKKCRELLSMALKGKEFKKEVLASLLNFLWYGETGKAIAFLSEIDGGKVANQQKLDELAGYFTRNMSHIPCYAVRQALGLRCSSNSVEKANDRLVSERQKRRSMSWSEDGSHALATLKAAKVNGEDKLWFSEGRVEFRLAAGF